jgi:hypothetical protein
VGIGGGIGFAFGVSAFERKRFMGWFEEINQKPWVREWKRTLDHFTKTKAYPLGQKPIRPLPHLLSQPSYL